MRQKVHLLAHPSLTGPLLPTFGSEGGELRRRLPCRVPGLAGRTRSTRMNWIGRKIHLYNVSIGLYMLDCNLKTLFQGGDYLMQGNPPKPLNSKSSTRNNEQCRAIAPPPPVITSLAIAIRVLVPVLIVSSTTARGACVSICLLDVALCLSGKKRKRERQEGSAMFELVISIPAILLLIIVALGCYLFGRNRGRAEAAAPPQFAPPAPPPELK
ncbi:hypothetical protein EJB05_38712, partial [Eragrostis curvula]